MFHCFNVIKMVHFLYQIVPCLVFLLNKQLKWKNKNTSEKLKLTKLSFTLPLIGHLLKKYTIANAFLNLSLNTLVNDFTAINSAGYFRYIGSLTTPPCTENVIWNVFNYSLSVSSSQVSDILTVFTSKIVFCCLSFLKFLLQT